MNTINIRPLLAILCVASCVATATTAAAQETPICPRDADMDGVDDCVENYLLQANAPVIHLAEGEVDWPMGFMKLIRAARLLQGDDILDNNPNGDMTPADVLNIAQTRGGDFILERRDIGINQVSGEPSEFSKTMEFDLDINGNDLHGENSGVVLAQKSVGIYGHVTPLVYRAVDPNNGDEPLRDASKNAILRSVIAVQYFVLFGNSDTHPEKYSSLCPKFGDALGDVAGPIAEDTVQPLLTLATDAIADGLCHDQIEPLIESYAHKGDWDEYEVFVNPISLLPVVQIWYRHGLRHVRSVPGWMPDNRRFNDLLAGLQGRDHNTKRDFTISQGKLPDQFKFLLDPVNDVINKGQKKYMDGTFDTFDVKDSLPAHGDVYVGLQGHEFWTDPGQDNWWHLWKKAGILTKHDTSGSNTYATGCPEPCATPATRIQNIGEIPFFIRIFEQDFFDPSIAVNSSFLARYSGHVASREAIMHNAGLTFQWPMYRHLRVDASGIFHIPDFSTDGAKRNLKMYPSGSFANPLLTLADAAKRLKDQSRTPEAPGSFILPITYVTLEAGHYPEAGHLPLVIDHPAILQSAGGNVVIGR